ncbi:BCNT-domain-containing protein [Suhomyces tanzawaensis NRRL Y-17324]|uniref:SWR1-complex protein 5 n=1 Tax=Suhomyces tanzawaensis NRRL Y-17324 TaxID=984487 RepID=A0A1E4SCZ3_9ASCO|nr:BCNT-domain-containing protein [Suhomyces tanzawaensis NRRL Y-17324]ODV77353.1 BCNT-domain-containing protein [Suhomyces tanzawaensis NRRL Y-17324]
MSTESSDAQNESTRAGGKAVGLPLAESNQLGSGPVHSTPSADNKESEDDDEEEEDDDYDPTAKQDDEEQDDEDDDDDEVASREADYAKIQAQTSQVRTRRQRQNDTDNQASRFIAGFETDERGLVKDLHSSVDIDAIFNDLKTKQEADDWRDLAAQSESVEQTPKAEESHTDDLNPEKIQIESSYTFAGRLITETKLVDADSAEAKAYLNSTASITRVPGQKTIRSHVTVLRTIPGTTEPTELKIKLKRPSLIDKFLSTYGSKKQKLSTLEKSRLDWASFVDKRDIADELKLHGKAGYLDRQDFLGRVQDKRDIEYQKAKDLERQRQWQLQQK